MDTLDFGAIMERECWFEEYDLTCPYCHGDPDHPAYENLSETEVAEVRVAYAKDATELHDWVEENKSGWDFHDPDEEDFEEWNDDAILKALELFEDDSGGLGDEIEEYFDENYSEFDFRCDECTEGMFEVMWNTAFGVEIGRTGVDDPAKFAFSMGFCLINHHGSSYLLMGSCGQDNTWRIHYTRWKIQGYLDREDIRYCLGSGGHVFLHGEQKVEFIKYLESQIPTVHSLLHDIKYRHQDLYRVHDDKIGRDRFNNDPDKDKYPDRKFVVETAHVVPWRKEVTAKSFGDAMSLVEKEHQGTKGWYVVRVVAVDGKEIVHDAD
jgi:hypothetical protein